jgi:hypothetical protein
MFRRDTYGKNAVLLLTYFWALEILGTGWLGVDGSSVGVMPPSLWSKVYICMSSGPEGTELQDRIVIIEVIMRNKINISFFILIFILFYC